jgi:hypothetical protein
MDYRDIKLFLVVCVQYFSAPCPKLFFSNTRIYKNKQMVFSKLYFLLGVSNYHEYGTISKHPIPICSLVFSIMEEKHAYGITMLSVCVLPFQLSN